LIKFQADADLDHDIVVAVRRREPAIDFASAADCKLAGVPDPEVLERSANQNRILITHDRRTMPQHFRDRIGKGESSPGVFIVSQFGPIGPVLDVIVMVWAASEASEWRDQLFYLPSLSRHAFSGD
jgi:hypothetical protein